MRYCTAIGLLGFLSLVVGGSGFVGAMEDQVMMPVQATVRSDIESAPASASSEKAIQEGQSLSIAEFTSRLKEIQQERNKVIADYNQAKKDYDKKLTEELNRLGKTPEDLATKTALMDEALLQQAKMREEYKERIELLKDREDSLRALRTGDQELSPGEKRMLYQKQLERESTSMREISDRIKKQNQQIRQQREKRASQRNKAPATERKPVDSSSTPPENLMPPGIPK